MSQQSSLPTTFSATSPIANPSRPEQGTPLEGETFPEASRDESLRQLFGDLQNEGDKDKALGVLMVVFQAWAESLAMHSWRRLPDSSELGDIQSDAVKGLRDALLQFDPARGIAFTTFAARRIQGAILDGLRERDPISRLQRQRNEALQKLVRSLRQSSSHVALLSTLAEELEIPEVEVDRMLQEIEIQRTTSIDTSSAKDSGEKNLSLLDQVAAHSPTPSHSTESFDFWRCALRGCSKQERLLVLLYFVEGLTMKEIGIELDLSESRISQMFTALQPRICENLTDSCLDIPRRKASIPTHSQVEEARPQPTTVESLDFDWEE